MITFLFPSTALLYIGSAIIGLGAAITWTGQGTYLARCSNADTISRNSGIFWALLQCSMFFGNLFVYYQFQDKTHIDKDTRNLVIGVLTAVAVLGIVFLAALRFMPNNAEQDNELEEKQTGCGQAVYALKAAGKLFLTKKMLLLSLAFFYTGRLRGSSSKLGLVELTILMVFQAWNCLSSAASLGQQLALLRA